PTPAPVFPINRGQDSVPSTQYSTPLVAAPAPAAGEPGVSATGVQTSNKMPPVADAPGSPGLASDHVQRVLLAVVADKTGYPPEMIDPDMGLDADLGIDSIKRVEILSAVQEQLPEAPAVKPEHLGTLQTLRQIAEFLCGEPGAS